MRKNLILPVFALLISCASIDHGTPPPADWPKMRTVIVDAHGDELNKLCCGAYACAKADFKGGVCYVVTPTRSQWVLDHEGHEESGRKVEGHCQGYDHPGERTTVGAWEHYKATGEYRQCKGS